MTRTQKDYRKWLAQFEGKPTMTHAAYAAGDGPGPDGVLLIRHDIDNDLANALVMARVEKELGVASAYAVLHTAPYYHQGGVLTGPREEARIREACEEFVALGHEVAIHNDSLSASVLTGQHWMRIFTDELAFLRAVTPDPIVGCAAHGNKLCYSYSFTNNEIFPEYCSNPRSVGIHPIPGPGLESYGLTWNDNPFPREERYSDSGGKMDTSGPMSGHLGFRGRFSSKGVIMALIHPQWWEV